jgi:hypothetical protein
VTAFKPSISGADAGANRKEQCTVLSSGGNGHRFRIWSKAELRQYGIADFIGERSRLDRWPLKDDIAALQIGRHPLKAALAKGFCKPLHRQLVSATNIYAAQQGYPDPSATGFECFRFFRRASHFMDQRTILNELPLS